MAKRDKPLVRPLSPFMHYRKWHSMTLSILHRITGVALTVGAAVLVYWLVAAASGAERYAEAQAVFANIWAQLALLSFLFSFCYHFLNGIRHLVWDTGRGFELSDARNSGYVVVVGAIALTAIVAWVFCSRIGGGL